MDLRGPSVAKLSSGVVSSVISSPSEGRDGIWHFQEVGGHVLTSVTIYHTQYSTILRNRIKRGIYLSSLGAIQILMCFLSS